MAHLCILNPTDFQLEIIYIVNDYRAKHQPLTKLTKQYSLLLLKTGYASNASCVTMLGLHASCSIPKDMNLQGSLTRAGHRAAKSTNSTEVSLMPPFAGKRFASYSKKPAYKNLEFWSSG